MIDNIILILFLLYNLLLLPLSYYCYKTHKYMKYIDKCMSDIHKKDDELKISNSDYEELINLYIQVIKTCKNIYEKLIYSKN